MWTLLSWRYRLSTRGPVPRRRAPLTNALVTSRDNAALNYPSPVIWTRTVSHHKDLEIRARTPRGQLLPPMPFFAETTTCWDGRWDREPCRGLLSTPSSTTVVAAAGPPGSTSQGARHRHLHQLRWWPLPNLPVAPPKGVCHRCLHQLRWWPLADLSTAPPGACHWCFA
jgi:hypothetical protein